MEVSLSKLRHSKSLQQITKPALMLLVARTSSQIPLNGDFSIALILTFVVHRQVVEDRTVRTIVAMAGGDQVSKRVRHRLHFGNSRVKIPDVRLGDALDLPARAAAIAP